MILFLIVFIMLIISGIMGAVLSRKLLHNLKEVDYKKWKELGSPSLFLSNSIKNNIAVWRFLRNKDYLKIEDNKLIKICKLYWGFNLAYLFLFTVFICFFLILILQSK